MREGGEARLQRHILDLVLSVEERLLRGVW